MKRSQVIEQIKYHLECILELEDPDDEILYSEAQTLLNCLEYTFKMLPPSAHYILTNMEGKKVGETYTSTWEPEDEI